MVSKQLAAVAAALVIWSAFAAASTQHPHAPADTAVTFSADVAPLLSRRCAGCHHPGGPGPFSVLDYDQVAARASDLVEAVETGIMPPWPPEPGFGGPFVGDRRISDADLALLKRWAAAGAPRGDAAPVTAAVADHGHPGTWEQGTPDLVVSSPQPFLLPANGEDVFRNFAIPLPLETARFVRRIEFLPGNHVVTHHANMRVDPSSSSLHLDELDPEPGYGGVGSPTANFPNGYFLGWTPGQVAPLVDPGLAWRVAPRSTLVVELHLVPSRQVERVDFRVGLYFSDAPPTRTPVMLRLGRQDIDIPAGAAAHVIRDSYRLPADVDVLSVQPHAHTLAREVKAWATQPDGSRRWLIYIRRWDFHNQHVYRFEQPPVLRKGTTVHMEYTYENTASPPRRVRWGQHTSDEMGDLWLQMLPRDPSDLPALTRGVRAKMVGDNVAGFRTLLEREPGNGLIRANLAEALLHAGKRDEALRHLRAHVRLEPDSAIAHANLATALSALGRQEDALREFRASLALDRGHVPAHTGIGIALLNQGDPEGALAAFREAIRLDPRAAHALNNAGVALERLGRPTDALIAYTTAVDLTVDDVDPRYNAARLFERFGRHGEAEELYRDALRILPDDVQTRRRLAWLLATSPATAAKRGEAVALAEPLAAEHRGDPDVLDVLAAARAATGAFREAVTAARTAMTILINRGERDRADAIDQRLSLYRAGRPYVLETP
jgi:tetratricopeptide (TPR) repeat protein/mono/diheme cytochrome c family protein